MKNGLCLAGGGVKGAAHIGAIKVFEEKGIKFDYVAGTSSGSIVAALYASGFTSDEMLKIFKKYCRESEPSAPIAGGSLVFCARFVLR